MVKVLDFGLGESDGADQHVGTNVSQSPTITTPAMTQAGMILGTAGYMSPEQAQRLPVDKRTDIWSFGVVLYEMLTGRRGFDGATTVEVLSNVLKTEPDWTALPRRDSVHRAVAAAPVSAQGAEPADFATSAMHG